DLVRVQVRDAVAVERAARHLGRRKVHKPRHGELAADDLAGVKVRDAAAAERAGNDLARVQPRNLARVQHAHYVGGRMGVGSVGVHTVVGVILTCGIGRRAVGTTSRGQWGGRRRVARRAGWTILARRSRLALQWASGNPGGVHVIPDEQHGAVGDDAVVVLIRLDHQPRMAGVAGGGEVRLGLHHTLDFDARTGRTLWAGWPLGALGARGAGQVIHAPDVVPAVVAVVRVTSVGRDNAVRHDYLWVTGKRSWWAS